MLVPDAAVAVDHERLGHAVDAVLDAHAPVDIAGGRDVGIAIARQPLPRLVGLVLVVQAKQRNAMALRDLAQHGQFVLARSAPRGPHVQQPHLAPLRFHVQCLAGFQQIRQADGGRGLINHCRRHRARIARQPLRKKHGHGQEHGKRQQIAQHQ